MANSINESCEAYNAPCIIARKQFDYLQSATAAQWGRLEGWSYEVSRDLIEPIEYAAGYTFSVTGYASSNISYPSYHTVKKRPEPWQNTTDLLAQEKPANIRGYVEFRPLSEFISAEKYTFAGRLFRNFTNPGAVGMVNTDTKTALNEIDTLSSCYVPVITWFYDHPTNGIQQWTHNFNAFFWNIATAHNYCHPGQSTMTGAAVLASNLRENISDGAPVYFGFGIPFKTSGAPANDSISPLLLSGYYTCKWFNRSTKNIILYGVDADIFPYFGIVCAQNQPTVGNSYPVDATSGLDKPAINLSIGMYTYPQTKYKEYTVCRDKQKYIDLWADFGIFISEDIDEVMEYQPPQTPPPDVNPDDPNDPFEHFPDNKSDIVEINPTYITPSSFGHTMVFTPTTIRNFLNWVCDNTVDISNWARLFANPADVITGINLFNLDIVAHDGANVVHNSITDILGVTTEIPNYSLLNGYNNIINGGTIRLQAYYGNYADFTSMSYQMFIPFVGFITLRASDVVNRTINLKYAVDFASGAAVAFVTSDDKLIYTSPCTVAGRIPVSTSDKNQQLINNTLSVIGGISGLMGGIASGNVGGGIGALFNGLGRLQLQTNYANRGSLSSVNIYRLIPAFIERTRFDLFLPSMDEEYIGAKYQTAAGAPSTQFDTLLNCVDAGGFVQSDVVYLTSQTATETEKQQIIDLIKSGVYL